MCLFNFHCMSTCKVGRHFLCFYKPVSARAKMCQTCHFLHGFKQLGYFLAVWWADKLFICIGLQLSPKSSQFWREEIVCNMSHLFRLMKALIFFLNQSKMCGRQKIPVCIEERQLPPTFPVKELTSVGLSILRQLQDVSRPMQMANGKRVWS